MQPIEENKFVKEFWKVDSSVVLKTTEGYALVDMDIQTSVFNGTLQEIYNFVVPYATRNDLELLFGMDLMDLED